MTKILKEKLRMAPKAPGCYLWKNKYNEIIYVGKAKNLYKRVHQYFLNINDSKKQSLVNEIADIEYILVHNENESLILENNLIKKYWPKYNILLKDQSEYPYIQITNDIHPQILYTRKIKKNSGEYYGPLADANFQKFKLYKLLNEIVPFRKCKKIPNKKCIYYDIGQCLAPCINKINLEEYKRWKNYISDLFKNKNSEIFNIIKQKELKTAELLNFEQAQKYKEIYDGLKKIQLLQIMEIANNMNNDYVSYYYDQNYVAINIFIYKENKFFSKFSSIHLVFDDYQDTIVEFLNNYYQNNLHPKKVVISLSRENLDLLNLQFNNIFSSPTTKQDQEILNLAMINAKNYLENHLLSIEYKNNISTKGLEELRQITCLEKLSYIEIYDNSNLNFTNAISGMIVYQNGKFNKKLSRHYKLKTEDNLSDFEYMKEVIYRRHSKHNEDVDLIIVDGGKIQVSAANEVLRQLNKAIPVIGLKKDQNHRTDAIILSDYSEIQLLRQSNLYLLLSKMQDDVHNFAIAFFREQKIQNDMKSILDSIKGLGKKRIEKIYSVYKNVDELSKATVDELSQLISKELAIRLLEKIRNK